MSTLANDMQFSESGSGTPVVLLDWTPWEATVLADALACRYRVFSVGLSDAVRHAGSAGEVAVLVAHMAEAAGLDSYAIIGTSLGADVALRVALLRPASVATLALVSPLSVQSVPRPWNTPELAAGAMLAHPEGSAHKAPDVARTATLSSLSDRWRATDGDAASLLPDVACATLAVFGQEDRLISRQAGGLWKELVPNGNVCYVYDAGHAIAVERPQALLNVVLDFVARRETFIVENRSSLINP